MWDAIHPPPWSIWQTAPLSSRPLLTSPLGGGDCHEDDEDDDDDGVDDDEDDDADDADDDRDDDDILSSVFADVKRGRAGRGRSGQS